MKSSPCGGCPPCCAQCVFSPTSETIVGSSVRTVVTKEDYGCVKGFDDVVIAGGKLGQLRGTAFHPVSEAGVAFLMSSRNPLAAHL